MTGVLITGKTRGRTEAVIASTVDQSVKATIPIEILSTNLLAYGPVSTDTIGVTIQADGGLKILSTVELAQGDGVAWPYMDLTEFIGQTLVLNCDNFPNGIIVGVRSNDLKEGASVWGGTGEQSFTVTAANAKSLRFSVKKGSASSIIDGVIHPRLNIGKSSEWMRPDVTNLEGGAFEMSNLFPTLDEVPSGQVTMKREGGVYRFAGTPSAWGGFYKNLDLEAGRYSLTCAGSGTFPNARIIIAGKERDAPAEFTLMAPANVRCQLTLNPTVTYDGTVAPRLVRLD